MPGALRFYDQPHLVGALAPRQVLVHNAVDGAAQRMSEPAATAEYGSAFAAYRTAGGPGRLQVSHGDEGKAALAKYLRE